jgi:hypothetical protein
MELQLFDGTRPYAGCGSLDDHKCDGGGDVCRNIDKCHREAAGKKGKKEHSLGHCSMQTGKHVTGVSAVRKVKTSVSCTASHSQRGIRRHSAGDCSSLSFISQGHANEAKKPRGDHHEGIRRHSTGNDSMLLRALSTVQEAGEHAPMQLRSDALKVPGISADKFVDCKQHAERHARGDVLQQRAQATSDYQMIRHEAVRVNTSCKHHQNSTGVSTAAYQVKHEVSGDVGTEHAREDIHVHICNNVRYSTANSATSISSLPKRIASVPLPSENVGRAGDADKVSHGPVRACLEDDVRGSSLLSGIEMESRSSSMVGGISMLPTGSGSAVPATRFSQDSITRAREARTITRKQVVSEYMKTARAADLDFGEVRFYQGLSALYPHLEMSIQWH